MKSSKTIILGITASIAAYKACELIRTLKKSGYTVKCVLTEDARNFVTPLAIETLSGEKVLLDMFAPKEGKKPFHISLADDADLVIIAPATCDIVCKMAAGICDDLLLSTVLSTKAPVIIAPAMNDNMYKNSVTQDKIKYLEDKGFLFVGPVKGDLVCGREGVGHLASLEDILAVAKKTLGSK